MCNNNSNNDEFASYSSSQTASRNEPGDLSVFQPGNSTQIYLGIGMGFLCYVPAQTPHKVSEISTMDLPPSFRVPLPLELNCEIFKCLKLPVQRKFIWGLGHDIYGMFGQKLLKKTKRIGNPHGNHWNLANKRATVAADGLNVSKEVPVPVRVNVFAVQPFPISGPQCRLNEFPGTILYYYEVKVQSEVFEVGLSDGANPNNLFIGDYSNSYAISTTGYDERFWLAGEEQHLFEFPVGAILPEWKADRNNVFGCGLVLDSEDKLAIFFTMNGKLIDQKLSISPTVDRLFPAVSMMDVSSFEANFGNDPANPFEYDIHNCPGLELVCI